MGRKSWDAASATTQAAWHARLTDLTSQLTTARGERNVLADARAQCSAQLDAHVDHAHDRQAAVEALVTKVGEDMALSAADHMRKGLQWAAGVAKTQVERLQHAFAQENANRDAAVHAMVSPLRDGIELLRDLSTRIERDRAVTLGTLQEQLRQLADGHQRLSDETSALTRALRTPQVRGRWGEMQLERLIEAAGMLKNVDFVLQPTLTSEDGVSRPDLIIHCPGGRSIICDAKVPLAAFLSGVDADTESERTMWMGKHAAQVRAHVDALSKRRYNELVPTALDIVFLFVPAESLYAEAVARDGSLVSYALDRRVMIVSPATLMLALRIVGFAWQQDALSETAVQVRELGSQLYTRIGKLAAHFEKVRRSLLTTVTAFNEASASLESRVLPTARKLHRLYNAEAAALASLEPLDVAPRALSAQEFVSNTSDVAVLSTEAAAPEMREELAA